MGVGGRCIGGFSSQGKTELAVLSTALRIKTLLEKKLLPAAQGWFGDEKQEWELQQDKASCHTAKSTKRWLEQHGVGVVEDWPTKGDDINPMENLWAILDDRLEHKSLQQRKE